MKEHDWQSEIQIETPEGKFHLRTDESTQSLALQAPKDFHIEVLWEFRSALYCHAIFQNSKPVAVKQRSAADPSQPTDWDGGWRVYWSNGHDLLLRLPLETPEQTWILHRINTNDNSKTFRFRRTASFT